MPGLGYWISLKVIIIATFLSFFFFFNLFYCWTSIVFIHQYGEILSTAADYNCKNPEGEIISGQSTSSNFS